MCPPQLKKEACSIYDSFLSESSLHAVNIDDTAQVEVSALETPTSDMFDKAQAQVHAMMKITHQYCDLLMCMS